MRRTTFRPSLATSFRRLVPRGRLSFSLLLPLVVVLFLFFATT